ncbi:hypothetical protein CLOM_g12345 [Closterium sp. NIES-68]|nr:hypothetical protein CLOM_g12345 [Closterium sp. NIES-68]
MQAASNQMLGIFRHALTAMGSLRCCPRSNLLEAYFKLSDPLNLQWQWDWLITAAWHLLSLLTLASLCFLWSPSRFSSRHDASVQDDQAIESLMSS